MSLQNELFDVVDQDDVVVGTATRAEVHAAALLHRAVHVFVFNRAGELFLQRRSMLKDSAPGKWVSSCSGHVDSGENYDEAVVRELVEELGLREPETLERVLKEAPCDATGNEFVWVYRCSSEGPFELKEDEIIDGKWVSLEELDRWMGEAPRDFAWSFTYLWELYRKHIDGSGVAAHPA